MHERWSQCEPVTRCALSSPGDALMSPSLCITCAIDHDLLAALDGQLLASVSASLNGDLPDHS